MTALNKKAAGWEFLAEGTNQQQIDKEIGNSLNQTISEIISIHNYRNIDPSTFEPLIINDRVYYPPNMSWNDIEAYRKRKMMEAVGPKAPKGYCMDCKSYCDGKHYRSEGKQKDYINPEDPLDEVLWPEFILS